MISTNKEVNGQQCESMYENKTLFQSRRGMAKQRYIKTSFWSDVYIEELNPIDKLLYMYLLTNDHTNLIGIYEITLRRIAYETGIDSEMVRKILSKFQDDDKIYYFEWRVLIKNFIKNQNANPSMKLWMEREFGLVPQEIIDFIQGVPSLYTACAILNLTILNLTKPNGEKKSSSKKKESPAKAVITEVGSFEKFWKLYPKKKWKAKCIQLRTKIDPSEYEAIYKWCILYSAETKWQEVKYIKHADTRLYNQCRLDYSTLTPDDLKQEMIDTRTEDEENPTRYWQGMKPKYETLWEWREDIRMEHKDEVKELKRKERVLSRKINTW